MTRQLMVKDLMADLEGGDRTSEVIAEKFNRKENKPSREQRDWEDVMMMALPSRELERAIAKRTAMQTRMEQERIMLARQQMLAQPPMMADLARALMGR